MLFTLKKYYMLYTTFQLSNGTKTLGLIAWVTNQSFALCRRNANVDKIINYSKISIPHFVGNRICLLLREA